jgi:hypothetical protein
MVSLDEDGEGVRIAQSKRRQQLLPVRHAPSVTVTPGVEAAPGFAASRKFLVTRGALPETEFLTVQSSRKGQL